MKVTLLKKVRKKYRFLKNDLDKYKIQQKHWLFGFQNINPWIDFMIWDRNDNVNNAFYALLYMGYSEYKRKSKIRKLKQNNWKVIWWKS